jgi:hypothetical protein
VFLAVAVLAASGRALASDTYPRVVAQLYQLGVDPACTLCHATIKGGDDTVTTKFGKNVEHRGARGKDPGSLQDALIQAASSGDDSDGDEVSDYEELRDGTDPNDGSDAEPDPEGGEGGDGGGIAFGEIPELPPLAEHGCSLGMPSNDSGLVGLPLFAVWAFRRRRAVRASRFRSEPAL